MGRREILKCLNDKNKNITFTVEKPDDYKEDNGNIPTLDFKIGINDDNTEYIMMFYEKPMASKYFTPADSAIGRVQRNQIVANDITRMLRRMSPKLVIKECKELARVLDNANNRLKYSGYNYYERLHIIEAGITNYKKRRRASKEKKERMFQTEGEAREKRDKKKLALRETWYRLPIVKKKKELKRKRPPGIHSSCRKQHTNTPPPPPEPQPPPPPPPPPPMNQTNTNT